MAKTLLYFLITMLLLGYFLFSVGCSNYYRPGYWTVKGPEGLITPEWESKALEVAQAVEETSFPAQPFGGTIEMLREPFPCNAYGGDLRWCNGISYGGYVKVVWQPDPTKSSCALAHELCHESYCAHPRWDCSELTASACEYAALLRFNPMLRVEDLAAHD